MTNVLRRFPDAAAGLSFEAELFARATPAVGLWTAGSNALVCPAAYKNRAGFTAAAARSDAFCWPVVTRPTGGGTVPQSPGILNLSMALTVRKKFTIEDGYRLITGAIRSGLGNDGQKLALGEVPGSYCDGRWNLSIAERKVVGTAQHWRPTRTGSKRILIHALLLVHSDIEPGTRAINAFHQDLALDPVCSETHTTLDYALGHTAPNIVQIADALHVSAHQHINAIGESSDYSSAA